MFRLMGNFIFIYNKGVKELCTLPCRLLKYSSKKMLFMAESFKQRNYRLHGMQNIERY